jgi:membrane-associated phospholipid phosphatase
MQHADCERPKFWGWPGGSNLIYAYGVLGPLLMGWFVLVFAGANYVTGLHDFRTPLYFTRELSIPLVPAMAVVYNTLHLGYSMAPFVLRTRPEMNALAVTWVLMTAVAGVAFLLLPFESGFPAPQDPQLGVWRAAYRWADGANLTFNMFPSLHVAWLLACVDVYSRKAPLPGKALLWLWGAAMMLSTLLTHFHHVADVVCGFLLAMWGSRVLYPRLLSRFQRQPA